MLFVITKRPLVRHGASVGNGVLMISMHYPKGAIREDVGHRYTETMG